MIRSTLNGGTSSIAKQRFDVLGLINNGVGGESLEAVQVIATGVIVERADALNDHVATETLFPSNSFNGTFE